MFSNLSGKITLRENKVLFLLLAAALVFRLVFALLSSREAFLEPDSADYLALADNIGEHFSYSKGAEPEIFRAPGYPAMIAPFRIIAGDSLLPIVLVQILLDTLTCFIVWLIVRRLLPKQPGLALFALFLMVFSACGAVSSLKILSETAFTFSFSLMLLLLLPGIAPEKNEAENTGEPQWKLLCAGLLFGVSCLLRAVLVPLLPVLALLIFWKTRSWTALLCFALPALFCVGAWTARNSLVAGYTGFSSVSSVNLYRYDGCAVLAHKKGIAFLEQLGECDAKLSQLGSQKEVADFCAREGKRLALENPILWMRLHLHASLSTLLPAEGDLMRMLGVKIGGNNTLGVLRTEGLFVAVKNYFGGNYWPLLFAVPGILVLLLKYALATIGLLKLRRKPILAAMLALFCLWFVFTPGPAAHPRFRTPIEPVLAVLAALGAATLLPRFTKKQAPPSAGA